MDENTRQGTSPVAASVCTLNKFKANSFEAIKIIPSALTTAKR